MHTAFLDKCYIENTLRKETVSDSRGFLIWPPQMVLILPVDEVNENVKKNRASQSLRTVLSQEGVRARRLKGPIDKE